MSKKLNKANYYQTSHLGLATALSLSFPIETISRSDPRKAYFIFKHTQELDKLIQAYWTNELKVSPQIYFAQLKVIKSRLYDQV